MVWPPSSSSSQSNALFRHTARRGQHPRYTYHVVTYTHVYDNSNHNHNHNHSGAQTWLIRKFVRVRVFFFSQMSHDGLGRQETTGMTLTPRTRTRRTRNAAATMAMSFLSHNDTTQWGRWVGGRYALQHSEVRQQRRVVERHEVEGGERIVQPRREAEAASC